MRNLGQLKSSPIRNDVPHSESFDAVVIANGHHRIPYWPPPWPGQEAFQGRIIHSHSYKDARNYIDKTIVAVGLGQSSIDVAVDLARIAKQVEKEITM